MEYGTERLIEPGVIFTHERLVVWHSGMVRGPNGSLMFGLQMDSPEPGLFRMDPAWELGGAPPIDSHIEYHGGLRSGGTFSMCRDRFSFYYFKSFPAMEDGESMWNGYLHIQVHPIDLQVALPIRPH
jgi:hypothetical protein